MPRRRWRGSPRSTTGASRRSARIFGGGARRPGAPRRRQLPLCRRADRPLRPACRCAALLRRAAGARHLRHDADPPRPLRPLLRRADRLHPEAPRSAGACRREHAADPASLRHRGERHRHHRGGPARAAGALRAARPLRDRRFDRQRHLRAGRRASRGRWRSSPPSASTTRSRACSTTPAHRPSISRISCCSPTTSATSTSSSRSAASWSARTAIRPSSRRATSMLPGDAARLRRPGAGFAALSAADAGLSPEAAETATASRSSISASGRRTPRPSPTTSRCSGRIAG